jgi:hypothetical protein
MTGSTDFAPRTEFNALEVHLQKLEQQFLAKHLAAPTSTPADYDLDVRSFCVLAHAALEQFFEDVASQYAAQVHQTWLSGTHISKEVVTAIICLAQFPKPFALDVEADEAQPQMPIYHQVSEKLRESTQRYQLSVDENHGISLRYLRTLFSPIGLHVDPGPDAESALTQLAKNRGAYAHRRSAPANPRFAITATSPEDVKKCAESCLKFCRGFAQQMSDAFIEQYDGVCDAPCAKRLIRTLRRVLRVKAAT